MPFLNRSTLTYPATNVFPNGIWEDTRNPTTSDFRNFFIGTVWINFVNKTFWIMVDRTATSGTWVQGASAGTGILTITGDAGGPVGPDGANNINLLSGSNLTITGNAGTNTLTVTLDGTVASSYVSDAGTATPAAGVLNVFGSGGTMTSAVGNTLTITSGPTVPTTFTTDAGVATPALNNLNVLGDGTITTSGAGSTVTLHAGATIATTYAGDVGTATPAANVITFAGAGGTSTSAAGSTVTITSTGGGIGWSEISVVGPTSMVVDHGYITNSASRVQLLLPLTAVQGSEIDIVGKGTGGWQINQNGGQQIFLISSATTAGAGGMLQSSEARACITLRCITTDTTWAVQSAEGNIIVT